jgi:hypothetical protein
MLSPKNSDAPKIPSAASAIAARRAAPTDQRDQRHDAALAVVVGAHHERHVGQRDDDRHRPEDHRDDAHDGVGADGDGVRIVRVEDGLERVDRAGPDVAEHHAERADREQRRARVVTRRRWFGVHVQAARTAER